jgi:hypothetical protein
MNAQVLNSQPNKSKKNSNKIEMEDLAISIPMIGTIIIKNCDLKLQEFLEPLTDSKKNNVNEIKVHEFGQKEHDAIANVVRSK